MHATKFLRTFLIIMVMTVFMVTGFLKLISSPQEITIFENWGYPLWLMYLTGVLNIICALGLCLRKTSLYSAIVLLLLLSTAIISNILTKQPLITSLPACILLCSLVFVIYLDMCKTKAGN